MGIWLGELISEYGIPNQGLSLIIFAGIVSRIPEVFIRSSRPVRTLLCCFSIMLVILVISVYAIVYVQQGQRKVPVIFPGRRVGNRMSMPVRSSLPLMINMAGMIPLIFAQTILSLPAILAQILCRFKTEWLANFSAGLSMFSIQAVSGTPSCILCWWWH